MKEQFKIEEVKNNHLDGAKIKVVGVGGGGGNMINHMIKEGIDKNKPIDLISVNTDLQALETSLAPSTIQLGPKLTKGLGAGMQPDIGRDAALESFDLLQDKLEGADLVFIAAGLGGGTGTGAAPVVAQAAKEIGALTVAIVTKPFRFEGKKRTRLALNGFEDLKDESDSIVVIPNDKLLDVVEQKLGIKDSFSLVDDILYRAVNGMSSIILDSGNTSDINVDFADVRTIMGHRGLALMGIGESQGAQAAMEAVKIAVNSPLFDDMNIEGAMGILAHFYIHPNYPLHEVSEAMFSIEDSVDEEAHVIFGTTTDEKIDPNAVIVTIIATGFENGLQKKEEEKAPIKEEPRTKTNTMRQSSNSVRQKTTLSNSQDTIQKRSSTMFDRDMIRVPSDDDELDTPPILRLKR